jgi:hypothetical protein
MRQRFNALVATLLITAMVFASGHTGTLGDPDIMYQSATTAIEFSDAYTSLGLAVSRIDVRITTTAGADVVSWSATSGWTISGGYYHLPWYTQASALSNATYIVYMRVWDNAGNTSAWSEAFYVVRAWSSLAAPSGMRTTS